LVTAVIAMMLVLSWAIWRFVEPNGQRLTRHLLSSAAARVSGWRQSTSMLDSSPASTLAEQEDMRVRGLG
jgi:peptidoglycan/LPS O-acetylase OafA/YrhL